MQFNEFKKTESKVPQGDAINGLLVCAVLVALFFAYPLVAVLEG